MRHSLRLLWVLLLLTVVACQGSGDRTLAEVDPTAVSADPGFDQVNAVVHRSCVPCHSDGGKAFSLETCLDIVEMRFSILDQVTDNLMPPGAWPRLTDEEKLTIQRWVENGAASPCD